MALQSQTRRTLLLAFLFSIAACGLVGAYCLLLGQFGELELKILGTTSVLGFGSMLALCAAISWERRVWYPTGPIAVAFVAAAAVVTLLRMWDATEHFIGNTEYRVEQLIGILWTLAVTLSVLTLLALARLRTEWQWVRWTTVCSALALAFLLICAILIEPQDDFWARVGGVLAIGTACGFIAVPILHRVSAIQVREQIHTAALSLTLTCPRCNKAASLAVGRSSCPHCGLHFSIEIEEDNCRKCGYPLYQLTSAVCPECGTPIAQEPQPTA